jgi:hypothetical protein
MIVGRRSGSEVPPPPRRPSRPVPAPAPEGRTPVATGEARPPWALRHPWTKSPLATLPRRGQMRPRETTAIERNLHDRRSS